MRTVLDEIKSPWFIKGIGFGQRELVVRMIEGIVATHPSDFVVAGITVPGTRSVDVTSDSRVFDVAFDQVLAHQVVDESYTSGDEYDIEDDPTDVVRVLSQSRFLDHILRNHGWMFDDYPSAAHYCVVSYDAIVDVLAVGPPIVTERSS